MILQDFVCKITSDFGTISGEIMPDKSYMTFVMDSARSYQTYL